MRFLKKIKRIFNCSTKKQTSFAFNKVSKKNIIINSTIETTVLQLREWSISRAADKSISKDDARAILAEFYEWILQKDNIEVVSLEYINGILFDL